MKTFTALVFALFAALATAADVRVEVKSPAKQTVTASTEVPLFSVLEVAGTSLVVTYNGTINSVLPLPGNSTLTLSAVSKEKGWLAVQDQDGDTTLFPVNNPDIPATTDAGVPASVEDALKAQQVLKGFSFGGDFSGDFSFSGSFSGSKGSKSFSSDLSISGDSSVDFSFSSSSSSGDK